MNYRHIYHAGNFADVFKHVLLITLVRHLCVKDKAFCYLETHAGIGHYDLLSSAAQKTQEASLGIQKLWDLLQTPQSQLAVPEPIADYVQLVQAWNEQQGCSQLRFYPGSPTLARQSLRLQDKMVLTELHPQDYLDLKQCFARDAQVAVHHLDGYLGLKAFLPPPEARGLVFIDPPFENTAEFSLILQHLALALRRFRAGTYAIWYPIKSLPEVKRFYQQLQASGIRKILCCEFHAPPINATALNACGMVIVNPPWQWQETAEQVLFWLSQNLTKPPGNYDLKWLAPE